MSNKQDYIDLCITFLFNQGLTQAEIALYFAVVDTQHIYIITVALKSHYHWKTEEIKCFTQGISRLLCKQTNQPSILPGYNKCINWSKHLNLVLKVPYYTWFYQVNIRDQPSRYSESVSAWYSLKSLDQISERRIKSHRFSLTVPPMVSICHVNKPWEIRTV